MRALVEQYGLHSAAPAAALAAHHLQRWRPPRDPGVTVYIEGQARDDIAVRVEGGVVYFDWPDDCLGRWVRNVSIVAHKRK